MLAPHTPPLFSQMCHNHNRRPSTARSTRHTAGGHRDEEEEGQQQQQQQHIPYPPTSARAVAELRDIGSSTNTSTRTRAAVDKWLYEYDVRMERRETRDGVVGVTSKKRNQLSEKAQGKSTGGKKFTRKRDTEIVSKTSAMAKFEIDEMDERCDNYQRCHPKEGSDRKALLQWLSRIDQYSKELKTIDQSPHLYSMYGPPEDDDDMDLASGVTGLRVFKPKSRKRGGDSSSVTIGGKQQQQQQPRKFREGSSASVGGAFQRAASAKKQPLLSFSPRHQKQQQQQQRSTLGAHLYSPGTGIIAGSPRQRDRSPAAASTSRMATRPTSVSPPGAPQTPQRGISTTPTTQQHQNANEKNLMRSSARRSIVAEGKEKLLLSMLRREEGTSSSIKDVSFIDGDRMAQSVSFDRSGGGPQAVQQSANPIHRRILRFAAPPSNTSSGARTANRGLIMTTGAAAAGEDHEDGTTNTTAASTTNDYPATRKKKEQLRTWRPVSTSCEFPRF